MKDITEEYTQFQRGMQVYICPSGVLIDKDGNEFSFKRNFSSNKMESDGKTYHRTGEIFEEDNHPVIVYREP